MMQLVHCSVVVPVNRNLLLVLTVRHREGGANFYLSRVRDSSEQCPNDSGLFILSSKIMIKDREKGNWMDSDRRSLSPGNRYLINAVQRVGLQTHAWLGVELKACWWM